MNDSYVFFGNTYDLSGKIPVFNGERLFTKQSIVNCIIEFIRLSGASFMPFEGMPPILRNYRFVSRSALVSYFRTLLDQYSSGLISRLSYVDTYGFTSSPNSGRLYHVSVHFNDSTAPFHRLLNIQEIAPYVTNLFDSQNRPSKIVIS